MGLSHAGAVEYKQLVNVEDILDVQVMAQRTCVCIVFKSHHTAPSSLPLVKVLACTMVPPCVLCPGSLGWGRGRTPGLAALDSKVMKRAVKGADVVLVRGGLSFGPLREPSYVLWC